MEGKNKILEEIKKLLQQINYGQVMITIHNSKVYRLKKENYKN
jgi:hypothetical protein